MKLTLFAILLILGTNLFAQQVPNFQIEKNKCFTVGILQGGGSIIGGDLEFLVTKRFGFQLGAGVIGYGAGLNYHL